jgi:lipopolysaccharide export system protein LptA
LLLPAAAWAQQGGVTPPQFDATKPIHIQAERLEADNEAHVIRFEGNVVATQDDAVMNADILLIHYASGAKKPAAAAGAEPNPMGGGEVERLIALGRVQIVQGDRRAVCDRAEYDQIAGEITLTGNPTVTQGQDVVRGSTIVVKTDTKQVEARGGGGGRVSVTITPKTIEKASEKKKGAGSQNDEEKTPPSSEGGTAPGGDNQSAPDAGK